ncbi:MAG: M15 family metallopeptidase [Lachnospiraceae bacterium]|nr:M15 family metallopeptidase [Lachnospiraceae bacterium]
MKNKTVLYRNILFFCVSVFILSLTGCRNVKTVQKEEFYIEEISEELFEKMKGKSFSDDCIVAREDLRCVHVMHNNFEGMPQAGEIVCNRVIAQDLLEIFKELYDEGYQIDQIRLMDEYEGDEERATKDDNTFCFNFSFIPDTMKATTHGLGVAVDLNSLYNPYVKEENWKTIVKPATAVKYIKRSKNFQHKIDETDLCYKLFIEHGFEWGGSWKDHQEYMHFELPASKIQEFGLQ